MAFADEILWTPERNAIRLLSEAAPHMIWLTDVDGSTLYVNPRWTAVTGQTYQQALGYGWLEIIHADDKEAAVAAFTGVKTDYLPSHANYRIRCSSGDYHVVLGTTYPLYDGSGQYIGYVGSHSAPEDTASTEKQVPKGKSFILSRRERIVLTWVAAGLTAEEIGGKMDIAPRTVEFHIHSSARKLRSSNRVQTVAKAAVFGEIDLYAAIDL